MDMELITIEIDKIIINPRISEHLGNINELARSIKEYGLISPILINKDNILLCGMRRIKACQNLGYNQIKALVVDLEAGMEIFNIESQENLCRKPLTTAELDKEIEIKRKYATDQIKRKSVTGSIWRKIFSIFRK